MLNNMEEGKKIAIISYITIIGTITAMVMNGEKKNAFAAFHIRQSLGIFISFFLLGYFVGYFDNWMATYSFWTFIFVLWIYGFSTALQGQMRTIPLLGDFFQKIFKNIE